MKSSRGSHKFQETPVLLVLFSGEHITTIILVLLNSDDSSIIVMRVIDKPKASQASSSSSTSQFTVTFLTSTGGISENKLKVNFIQYKCIQFIQKSMEFCFKKLELDNNRLEKNFSRLRRENYPPSLPLSPLRGEGAPVFLKSRLRRNECRVSPKFRLVTLVGHSLVSFSFVKS